MFKLILIAFIGFMFAVGLLGWLIHIFGVIALKIINLISSLNNF